MVSDKSNPTPKRRVKNPETFREKALKASQSADQPKKRTKVGGFFRSLGMIISWPFVKIAGTLGKIKFLRPFGRLLKKIGRVIFPKYFRDSYQELKLVTWPNWKHSRQLTFAVLVFAVIFGVLIAGVDYGLDKLFRNILLK